MRWYNKDGKENIAELYYAIIRLVKWFLFPHMSKNSSIKFKSKSEESLGIRNLENLANLNTNEEIINNSDEILSNDNKYEELDNEDLDNIDETDTDENDIDEDVILSEQSNRGVSNAELISKNKKFHILIRYFCNSLRRLQETYKYGNVVLAIQFYINILEDGLDGKFDINKLPQYINKREEYYDNFLDYDKIKNLWSIEKIELVHELYENCFRILERNDMTPETKDVFIKGYLTTINSNLRVIDKKFQKLIRNSNRG